MSRDLSSSFMPRQGPGVLLALALALALAPGRPPDAPDIGPELLVGRVWIDVIIEGTNPYIPTRTYRFADDGERGTFDTVDWDSETGEEIRTRSPFRYRLRDDRLSLTFLETGESFEARVHVECATDRTLYHDLMLELSVDPRSRTGRYYYPGIHQACREAPTGC